MKQNDDARREYLEAVRLEATSPQIVEAIAVELTNLGFPEDAAAARAKAGTLRRSAPPQVGVIRK
jgi:hypothetical protein